MKWFVCLIAGGVVGPVFGANDLPESMDGGSTYGFWATPLVLKGEKKPVDEKNPMKDLEKRRDWAEMYRRADDSTEGLGWRYGAALCLARDELVGETLAKLRAKPLDDALVDAYLNAARIIGRFLYYTGHLAVEPTLRPLLAHETAFTPGQQFKVQSALLGAYDKGRDYARAAECFRKLQLSQLFLFAVIYDIKPECFVKFFVFGFHFLTSAADAVKCCANLYINYDYK